MEKIEKRGEAVTASYEVETDGMKEEGSMGCVGVEKIRPRKPRMREER